MFLSSPVGSSLSKRAVHSISALQRPHPSRQFLLLLHDLKLLARVRATNVTQSHCSGLTQHSFLCMATSGLICTLQQRPRPSSHSLQAALEGPAKHPHQIFLHAFLVQTSAIPAGVPPAGIPGKNTGHGVKRQQTSLRGGEGPREGRRRLQYAHHRRPATLLALTLRPEINRRRERLSSAEAECATLPQESMHTSIRQAHGRT